MLTNAAAYRRAHGSNLFEDVVASELAAASRIVTANEHWVAFVPFAGKWPYELHLYPRVRVPSLVSLGDAERETLGSIYQDVLRRFGRLFPTPAPYVAAWHQAPTGGVDGVDEAALHLELFTNRRSATALKYPAGTESAMDMWSNDVVPEEAASRLRELG
jgi:UDPglucose--hexose-1-phosphate uridylyltransferase